MNKKIALAALLLSCQFAHAWPDVTVSYIEPTGTATTADIIEIWVRVSSDRPLGTELGAPFGFDLADLPKTATVHNWEDNTSREVAFASYTAISLIPGRTCIYTCDVMGYTFKDLPQTPDRPSFSNLASQSFKPGDYLLGGYVPDDTVTPGDYIFPAVPFVMFNVSGLSATGEHLNAYLGPTNGFSACHFEDRNLCMFRRTITAVPEPGTMATFALGMGVLAGLGAWQRRRSGALAA